MGVLSYPCAMHTISKQRLDIDASFVFRLYLLLRDFDLISEVIKSLSIPKSRSIMTCASIAASAQFTHTQLFSLPE